MIGLRISTGCVGVIENTGRDIVQCGMAEPAKFLLSVLLDDGFGRIKGAESVAFATAPPVW